METKAYFKNIRRQIMKELGEAQFSVIVAVAWFTDKEILDLLRKKAKEGIRVVVLSMEDAKNAKSLPWFESIVKAGGSVYLVPEYEDESLMHNKFCVIDDTKVINGSYNWTYNAARKNKENITVITGNPELADEFTQEFFELVTRYYPNTAPPPAMDLEKVIKRFDVIRNLIGLGDIPGVKQQAKHISRLRHDVSIQKILKLIYDDEIPGAVAAIEEFIKKNRGLVVYVDPEIAALLFENDSLDLRLEEANFKKMEITKKILQLEAVLMKAMGSLIKDIIYLRREIVMLKRSLTTEKKEKSTLEEERLKKEYEEIEREWEKYESAAEKNRKQEDVATLTEEDAEQLSKMYRKAAHLCHPDKFSNLSEMKQKEAAKMFVELNEANRKNDIERVTEILEQIEKGSFAVSAPEKNVDKEELRKRVIRKREKIKNETADINELLEKDEYKLSADRKALDAYIKGKVSAFKQELESLKKEFKKLQKEVRKSKKRTS
ncbi:MAG: hypothetical protein A2762_04365 [Candidatus Lloydbacteria bacterium RIFCSPHIGHO2_01_FULL_54_11]|nr:MAG: hypothetical protein A2762_04365 [Candidatus Lloydbacteria bacterium RIFCSPHIGHO2_01_FULL_54_11]OGZ14316.1 MAG: hypothetical protein A2948_01870 [Candidatus Lloydbacteria bacterium RIFCSPLOWO2_01_FULL_54_18]OGZ16016.1 MAG: hypothetical protein A3H76_00610 [Candidatus Lloydbacteria bacterium RIFCSPLOWO2_02_FULL_54_12]